MIRPPFLNKNDQILLISPAGKIESVKIEGAIKILESWGLQVKISDYAFGDYNIFSGTDNQRLSDLQLALDDKNIKAIICMRGGYGTIRLLDKLDFQLFKHVPKWIVGYSDITVLHAYLNSIVKCESIHGIMAVNFPANGISTKFTESLRKILFGETLRYEIPNHELNRYGKAIGELIGGNLSIITSLMGTAVAYITKSKILFIEEIGENLYKLDRMMHQLKLSGKLKHINGLVVGGMTQMIDDPQFGKESYGIIYDAVKTFNYPLIFNFPAGHLENNIALHLGRRMMMKVTSQHAIMMYKDLNPKKSG